MRISVVINTINRDKDIVHCLESLKQQTDKDFEVIVVDQSKNRRTKQAVRPFILKYYRLKKRNNLAFSRNFGINKAAGEIVAFMDDDSKADPSWIANIRKSFSEVKPSLLAGRVVDYTDPANPLLEFQNGIVNQYGQEQKLRPLHETVYVKGNKGWYSTVSGTNMSFLKSRLLEAGGFDEYFEFYYEETDLTIRMIKNEGHALYNDQVIVGHYFPKGKRGKRKKNWRIYTKNRIYFSLKNGKAIFPLRLVKSLSFLFGFEGPFLANLKLFFHRKTFLLPLIQNYLTSGFGIIQGLRSGLFGTRQLRKNLAAENKFVLFRPR